MGNQLNTLLELPVQNAEDVGNMLTGRPAGYKALYEAGSGLGGQSVYLLLLLLLFVIIYLTSFYFTYG